MDWGRALAAVAIALLINMQLVAAGIWPPMYLETQLAQLNPPPPGSWIYDYFTSEQLDFILRNWNSQDKYLIVDKKGNIWSVGQGDIPSIVLYAIQVYNSNIAQAVVDYMSIYQTIALRFEQGNIPYFYVGFKLYNESITKSAYYMDFTTPPTAPWYNLTIKRYCSGAWYNDMGWQHSTGTISITVRDDGIQISYRVLLTLFIKKCFNENWGPGVTLSNFADGRFTLSGIDPSASANSTYSYTINVLDAGFYFFNATSGTWQRIPTNYTSSAATITATGITLETSVTNAGNIDATALMYTLEFVGNVWYTQGGGAGTIIYEYNSTAPDYQNNTQQDTCIIDNTPKAPPIALAGLIGGSGGQEAQWIIHENPFNFFWAQNGFNGTDPDIDQFYHVAVGWAWSTVEPTTCDLIMQSRITTLDLSEYSFDWNYLLGNVSVDGMLYDTQLPPTTGNYYFTWINIFDDKANRTIIVKYYNVSITQAGQTNTFTAALVKAFRPVIAAIKSGIQATLSFAWDLLPQEFKSILTFLADILKNVVVGLIDAIVNFPLVVDIVKLFVVMLPALVIAIMVYDPFAIVDLFRKLMQLISQIVQAIRSALPLP